MGVRAYILQRATAALLLPLVLGHLAMIYYATTNKLTAADILSRTEGSIGWALFYGAFVVLIAVHGAIGFASIAREWFGLRGNAQTAVLWSIGALIVILGLRAVLAVTLPGAATR